MQVTRAHPQPIKKAVEGYRKEQKLVNERRGIVENIFRAAITDIKLGAAAIHLETLLSLLSECAVNIGQIGHSRKHLSDILYCIEKEVNVRMDTFLRTPLASTNLPPFYWVTVDKGTPSRTTNQAIVIVALYALYQLVLPRSIRMNLVELILRLPN